LEVARHVDVSMVNSSDELDIELKLGEKRYKDAEFICDDNGKYIVVEKSKKCQIQIQCSD
jgi:leucyl-tRNA synthetase